MPVIGNYLQNFLLLEEVVEWVSCFSTQKNYVLNNYLDIMDSLFGLTQQELKEDQHLFIS